MTMNKVGKIDDPIWSSSPGVQPQTGRPRAKHRVIAIGVLTVIALGVVYPLAAAGLSRKDYGTFAFWKLPNRIDFCGRRYYSGETERGNPALFESQDSAKGARWTFLSWTFSGRSIYADVAPSDSSSATACTMMLYIPLGGDRWETYALSGGP